MPYYRTAAGRIIISVGPTDSIRSDMPFYEQTPAGRLIPRGGAGSGNFGHSGRPGEVGGSASQGGASGLVGSLRALPAGMIEKMLNIRNDPTESVTIFTPDGIITAGATGDDKIVTMDISLDDSEGNFALHNHPVGEGLPPESASSFSHKDILSMFNSEQAREYVVSQAYVYEMINKSGFTRFSKELPVVVNHWVRQWNEFITSGGYEKASPVERCEKTHEYWVNTAKEFPHAIKYNRYPIEAIQ